MACGRRDDERIKALIQHIIDEEKEHVGEFTAILQMLDPEAETKYQDGLEDGKLMLAGQPHPEEGAESEPQAPQGFTVGSLIGE
jgi:rubrerythrin